MKEIKTFLKSPLFYFHGNSVKVCSTDSDYFGLSHSTRCGCCSYQVSSISVWWVTRYDHFCVFQFFGILSVLVKIWFPSRSWSCELIIVIVFGIGSHGVGWYPLLLCNGNSSSYYYFSTRFCPLDFSEMPWSNFMKACRNIICHVKLCC
jgi:hypothetical protein